MDNSNFDAIRQQMEHTPLIAGFLGGMFKSFSNLLKGKINIGDVMNLGGAYLGFGGSAPSWLKSALGGQSGIGGKLFGKMNTGDYLKAGMGALGAQEAGAHNKTIRGALGRSMGFNKYRETAGRAAIDKAMAYDPATEDQAAVDYAKDVTGQSIGIGLRNVRDQYGQGAEGDTNFRIDNNWQVDRLTRPAEAMAAELAATRTQRKVSALATAIGAGQPIAATYSAIASAPMMDMTGALKTLTEGISGPASREGAGGGNSGEQGVPETPEQTQSGRSVMNTGGSTLSGNVVEDEGSVGGIANSGLRGAMTSFSPKRGSGKGGPPQGRILRRIMQQRNGAIMP